MDLSQIRSLSVFFGETFRRNSRIHGRNSRHFFLILLCTLCHFVSLGHQNMVKRASKKYQNGSLGGLLGEVLGDLGGPSTASYRKRELKNGSLTPSATFFGTQFWTLFEP